MNGNGFGFVFLRLGDVHLQNTVLIFRLDGFRVNIRGMRERTFKPSKPGFTSKILILLDFIIIRPFTLEG